MAGERRALLLNGAHSGDDLLLNVEQIVVGEFERAGWRVEPVRLDEQKVAYCTGCFNCWVKNPGECIIRDDNRSINARIIESDALILLSRVTFGGYSSALKRMMDHLIPLVLPFFQRIDGEIHHQPRYRHYPDLFGVGILNQPDDNAARLFQALIERNTRNFHGSRSGSVIVTAQAVADDGPRQIHAGLGAFVEVLA